MENLYVDVGDGAVITFPAPKAECVVGLAWKMRYGDAEKVRYTAAGVIESYSYLILECSEKEILRRVRAIRKAVAEERKKINGNYILDSLGAR
jgi:hypothetical protein